eukprot:TRINITY_DN11497_c0_g2_i14.p1 TRINITY_DN11497_c0_g2~~TRINITY_DN11497_c0_g2_i14.p1  ORF type:complete len:237 (-),score=67.74 TRINITY_DN11497_c0_g2_i14:133-741(-)
MEEANEAEYEELKGKTRLNAGWKTWEHWEDDSDNSDEAYLRNMQPVAQFDNWVDFWRCWNCLPHATPTFYFGEYHSKEKIYVKIKDKWVHINAISLSRGDSKPTWEDPINAEGVDFSSVINGMSDNELKELWTKLVIYSIGSIHTYHKNITAVRLIEKRGGAYKFELWTDKEGRAEGCQKSLKEELEKLLTNQINVRSHLKH